MKKINFQMMNYLIFSVLVLISAMSFLYVYFKHSEWEEALLILTSLSGCAFGGWLAFTMIFLPTFSSYKIFEIKGR
ncbi:hypothetical protein BK837_004446 [Escherichia coli]|nr:hypothetical protein [Escherichia coli]EFG0190461.1 hypothetical protein [Escherichia coli]